MSARTARTRRGYRPAPLHLPHQAATGRPARRYAHELTFKVVEADRSSWVIRRGVSRILVAEGAGWTADLGRALFAELRRPRTIYGKPRRRQT